MLWAIVITCVLGGLAIYALLPRPGRPPAIWGALAGAAAILLAGFLLTQAGVFAVEAILFYFFSAVAVLSGALLVTQRNPVHAALSFALVVLSTCGIFLIQAAPFLMAATIIVYAGAIVVTFLFVIMLAQQEGRSDADFRSREPLLSTVAAFVLLGALLFVIHAAYNTRTLNELVLRARTAAQQNSVAGIREVIGDDGDFFARFRGEADRLAGTEAATGLRANLERLEETWRKPNVDAEQAREQLAAVAAAGERARATAGMLQPGRVARAGLSRFSVPNPELTPNENVAPLGRSLFTDYLLPVELAGTLLLVATIGAIAIAGRRTGELR